MLTLPSQVSAEKMIAVVGNSCLTCHEDLYYLHDTGSHCCITEHRDRCVDCHEGDKTVMSQEESHLGLLSHPQENNGAKCLECHTPELTEARLAEMASTVGFDTLIVADAYEPTAPVTTGSTDFLEVNSLRESMIWATGATLLFGLWLLLVIHSPSKP
jgi:hypothetical protein